MDAQPLRAFAVAKLASEYQRYVAFAKRHKLTVCPLPDYCRAACNQLGLTTASVQREVERKAGA